MIFSLVSLLEKLVKQKDQIEAHNNTKKMFLSQLQLLSWVIGRSIRLSLFIYKNLTQF